MIWTFRHRKISCAVSCCVHHRIRIVSGEGNVAHKAKRTVAVAPFLPVLIEHRGPAKAAACRHLSASARAPAHSTLPGRRRWMAGQGESCPVPARAPVALGRAVA